MRVFKWMPAILALILAALAWVGPAQAQATRTWVSGVGDDANPCSRTAPCKTFAGSISKTAAGGEINCLDPGGFGAVTITKAIAINCEGVIAGVLVSGTNGVVVAAGANDKVLLRGLDIEGLGTGLDGISFISGASLVVDHVSVRHFNGNGLKAANNAATEVTVSNSQFFNNGGAGVLLTASAALNLSASLDNVHLEDNVKGLSVNAGSSSGAVRVNLQNGVVTGNSGTGVLANGGTGTLKLMVDGSSIVNNGVGVSSSGAKSQIFVSDSSITGNQTGASADNGGLLVSYGNNRLNGNVVSQGGFTSTVTPQ